MKIKYPLPQSGRWDFMRWYDIPSRLNPGDVYLRRLRIVQTPWFSILFHKIYEPDDGIYPHDHPWNFRTIILSGGYVADEYKTLHAYDNHLPRGGVHGSIHTAWSTYRMTTTEGHQITHISPNTKTLVFTGKRTRTFCFWTPQGKIPYNRMGKINDVE